MSNFFPATGTMEQGPRRDGTFKIQWIGTLAQFKRQKKVKVSPLSLILLFITTPFRLPVGFHDLTLRWRAETLFYIFYGLGWFEQWNKGQYAFRGRNSSVRENRRFKGETQFGSLNLSFELSLRRHVAWKPAEVRGCFVLRCSGWTNGQERLSHLNNWILCRKSRVLGMKNVPDKRSQNRQRKNTKKEGWV